MFWQQLRSVVLVASKGGCWWCVQLKDGEWEKLREESDSKNVRKSVWEGQRMKNERGVCLLKMERGLKIFKL